MRVSCTPIPGAASGSGSRAQGGVFGRVPGEAGRGARGDRWCQGGQVFGGLGQHRGDLSDRDDIQLQGARAGGIHRVGAVLAHQPDEPVNGAHPRPRQRVIQDPLGIDPDVFTRVRAGGDQLGDVPQGVGAFLRRQVLRVGAPGSGFPCRVGLDQLSAVIDLHQLGVGTDLDLGADVVPGHRIQGLVDLEVVVPVHLGVLEHRHVVVGRHRQQPCGFLGVEDLQGPGLGGAVDPHPRLLRAPGHGPGLGVLQVQEGLAGEEVPAHVLHDALHPRLVLRGADPGRVGAESRMRRVVQPARW